MAGLQTYSQVVTPEPSPAPSPAPTPGASQPVSPMATDPPPPDPVILETAPNQFGFFHHFTQWLTVDPEMDITIDDLIDAPTFTNTSDHGYHNPDDSFDPSESSNLFTPYLNTDGLLWLSQRETHKLDFMLRGVRSKGLSFSLQSKALYPVAILVNSQVSVKTPS